MATATTSDEEFDVTAVVPLELARKIRTDIVSGKERSSLEAYITAAIDSEVADTVSAEKRSPKAKRSVEKDTVHINISVPASVARVHGGDMEADGGEDPTYFTISKLEDIITAIKDLPLSDFGIKPKVRVQTQFSSAAPSVVLPVGVERPQRLTTFKAWRRELESDEQTGDVSTVVLKYTYEGDAKQLSFSGEKTLLGLATALAQKENLPLHEQSMLIGGSDRSVGTCKGFIAPTMSFAIMRIHRDTDIQLARRIVQGPTSEYFDVYISLGGSSRLVFMVSVNGFSTVGDLLELARGKSIRIFSKVKWVGLELPNELTMSQLEVSKGMCPNFSVS